MEKEIETRRQGIAAWAAAVAAENDEVSSMECSPEISKLKDVVEEAVSILEDMLRACILDFGGGWHRHLRLAKFAYNNSYQTSIQMAPFEALYGRKCRSPLFSSDVGERRTLGPELLLEAEEKVRVVRRHLLTAQSRQRSYADTRRRDLEFQVGDYVFLKVSPSRGIRRFGVRGKLSPRFVGPFEVMERVGPVAYRIALPPRLAGIHNVFHVSALRRYVFDPSYVIDFTPLEIGEDLRYEERLVRILAREMKELRNLVIPYVKVQWSNHEKLEVTWEPETVMRESYPDLFVAPS
uniref:Tf2-1-like SH3-like domain-containing protein n=1 Tax=Ananas comosus var. bracteatus TaxID=296719 RepID=A0A6V7NIM9_ANACO|nr:unnamed protein product [Ananas comosus var. bracteatus]